MSTEHALPAEPGRAAVYRKIGRRILPLLFIGLVVAYLDRLNISYAKAQMQSDIAMSDTAYGIGAGIFFLGYILFEVPSNLMLARVGARAWLFRIMLSWGVVSGLMMFVTDERTFYAIRFLLGVAEAGFIPGVLVYLAAWFPSAWRARVTAKFIAGAIVAGIIGGPIAAAIIEPTNGLAGLHGWQWLFLVEGAAAVVLAFVLLAALHPTPETASWLTEPEKRIVRQDLAAEHDQAVAHTGLRAAARDRRTIHLIALYFLTVFSVGGVTFWAPQVLLNAGVKSASGASLLSAAPYAVAIGLQLLIARSSDRRGDRKWHIVGASLLSTLGWAVTLVFGHSPVLALAGMAMALTGAIAGTIVLALPPTFLRGSAAAGGLALVHAAGNLGSFLSPYTVGAIADTTGTLTMALALLSLGPLLCAVLALFLSGRLAHFDTRADSDPVRTNRKLTRGAV